MVTIPIVTEETTATSGVVIHRIRPDVLLHHSNLETVVASRRELKAKHTSRRDTCVVNSKTFSDAEAAYCDSLSELNHLVHFDLPANNPIRPKIVAIPMPQGHHRSNPYRRIKVTANNTIARPIATPLRCSTSHSRKTRTAPPRRLMRSQNTHSEASLIASPAIAAIERFSSEQNIYPTRFAFGAANADPHRWDDA